MAVMSTNFQHKRIYNITWLSTDQNTASQIDHIIKNGNKKGDNRRCEIYVGGPKSNRTLNLVHEPEVVLRCAVRCCRSIQYSSSLPRGVNLG